jgi:hypothetical protein
MTKSLPHPTEDCQANLADKTDYPPEDGVWPGVNVKETLWRNLCGLMNDRWGVTNLRRLSKESGVSESSLYRMKPDFDGWPTLDNVTALARVFRREAWQLLHPRMDAKALSDRAMALGALFDTLPLERQARVYALMVQLLEFGNTGRAAPVDEPTDEPSERPEKPPEDTPPAPRPKRGRAKDR